MTKELMSVLPQLRYQSTQKRVRARLGDAAVADSRQAMLIWEPMRVVPSYAIPETDITADLVGAPAGPPTEYRPVGFGADSPPLLDPSIPFAVHTAAGEPLTVRTAGGTREPTTAGSPGVGVRRHGDAAGCSARVGRRQPGHRHRGGAARSRLVLIGARSEPCRGGAGRRPCGSTAGRRTSRRAAGRRTFRAAAGVVACPGRSADD